MDARRVTVAAGDGATFRWAMVWQRGLAYMLDVQMLAVAGSLAGRLPMVETTLMDGYRLALPAWAGVLLFFAVPERLAGRTVGKAIVGLRVTDARSGGRPGLGRSVLRRTPFLLSCVLPSLWSHPAVLLVLAASVAVDGSARGLHDRMARVTVQRSR